MPDRYLVVVEPEDNVATAIREIDKGETIEIDRKGETVTVKVSEDVPFGHKIALEEIPEDKIVKKYGLSIGYASRNIEAGEWVHAHNVDSNYGRGDLSSNGAVQAVSE